MGKQNCWSKSRTDIGSAKKIIKCKVESMSNLAQMQRKIAMKGRGKKLRKKVALKSKTGKERIQGLKWIIIRKQKEKGTE